MYQFSDIEIQRVAQDILNYLKAKPHQKDTLKGLCEWWLLEDRLDGTIDLVTEALGYLLSQRILIEVTNGRLNTIYQLNPALNRCGKCTDFSDVADNRPRA